MDLLIPGSLASENAIMGEPEIRAGVGPPLLITPFSVNLANAKEMLLTGDTVDAHARAGPQSRIRGCRGRRGQRRTNSRVFGNRAEAALSVRKDLGPGTSTLLVLSAASEMDLICTLPMDPKLDEYQPWRVWIPSGDAGRYSREGQACRGAPPLTRSIAPPRGPPHVPRCTPCALRIHRGEAA